jgi:hypothetical protein
MGDCSADKKGCEHMAVTLKLEDNHLYCSTHGDLGVTEEALKGHKKAMYAEGEYHCMDCLFQEGEEEHEDPPQEMWCEYHKLYHWPCF